MPRAADSAGDSHTTIGTRVCVRGAIAYGSAVQVQAAFAERFAVVGDVDQRGVVLGLRGEQADRACEEFVGVQHRIVVGC